MNRSTLHRGNVPIFFIMHRDLLNDQRKFAPRYHKRSWSQFLAGAIRSFVTFNDTLSRSPLFSEMKKCPELKWLNACTVPRLISPGAVLKTVEKFLPSPLLKFLPFIPSLLLPFSFLFFFLVIHFQFYPFSLLSFSLSSLSSFSSLFNSIVNRIGKAR